MKRFDSAAIEQALRIALSAPVSEQREGVDMSRAAIAARVRELCDLSSLCLQLAGGGSGT